VTRCRTTPADLFTRRGLHTTREIQLRIVGEPVLDGPARADHAAAPGHQGASMLIRDASRRSRPGQQLAPATLMAAP
jgi:hypothetical protein